MNRYISTLIIFLVTASSTFGILTEVEASKKLPRDEARNILISRNLVISIDWCVFPGKCPDKTFHLQNAYGFFLEGSDAGIKVSREILSSYLSCLESKNLVRYAGKTRGSKGSFSWDSWLETTGSGEPFHLTEIGQKYIDNKSKFVISVNVDKITGIQFREEETVAKVFFDATTKSSDNPFNKCFEDYFDVRSLLNEPYAMFELFDDGWRFKDWNTGGSLKQKDQTLQKELKKREIPPEEPLKKELTLEAALRQERERINRIEHTKKQQMLSLDAEGIEAMNKSDWNTAIQKYKKLLEIDPENYGANVNLGGSYAMLNEFDLSIQYLLKANQLIPAAPEPYVNMVYAYARKGDKDRAIEALQKAIDKGYKKLSSLKRDEDLPEDFRQDPRFEELTRLNFAKLTEGIKDADLFDNHVQKFPYRYDDVWAAVDYVLKDQDEKIIQADKETEVIVTDLTRHGFIGFPRYDKYYILIEKIDETSSKLNLKLFIYYRDMKGKGLTELILKPESKSYVNERAMKFLGKVKETLKEKGQSTQLQLKRLWSSNHPEENIIALTYGNAEQGSDAIKTKITLANSTGTWVVVQQSFNPSASAKISVSGVTNVHLLGPFYNKGLGTIEFPKGSFLQLDARSPLGIKGSILEPINLSLIGVVAIDLMMRGFFNKELPPNAFDNSIVLPTEVGLSSIDPLFKTITSHCSGHLGALGNAIGTKNTEDALKAIAGFALCTRDVKEKMQEWLAKHYSKDIAEKYVQWTSKNIVDILDAPTRATLIGLLTKYTFSAPPESWVRIEAVEN